MSSEWQGPEPESGDLSDLNKLVVDPYTYSAFEIFGLAIPIYLAIPHTKRTLYQYIKTADNWQAPLRKKRTTVTSFDLRENADCNHVVSAVRNQGGCGTGRE